MAAANHSASTPKHFKGEACNEEVCRCSECDRTLHRPRCTIVLKAQPGSFLFNIRQQIDESAHSLPDQNTQPVQEISSPKYQQAYPALAAS